MINVLLIGVHIVACLLMILFVLLHSGKGTGLSDVFGGGSGGAFGGAGAVERNLDRITIGAAVVFLITTVLLGLRLT